MKINPKTSNLKKKKGFVKSAMKTGESLNRNGYGKNLIKMVINFAEMEAII